MGETILELQNIAKHFGDTDVLNGISISIGKGEFITLLGPSGCGKTTTLRIIAGLETPDEGRVILNGQDVTDSEPNKRDVNTVFQNYALFPHMTVAANIGYSLKLKKRPKDEIKKAVDDALALVQLSGYGKRMPAELSGGQRQRLAMARALLHDSPIYVFDEATSNVDAESENDIMQAIHSLAGKKTIILISHRLANVVHSDCIYAMSNGRVIEQGTHAELLAKQGAYSRLYLHNTASEKWQFLNSYKDGTITADTAGSYLLTNQNLRFTNINWTFFIAAGALTVVCLIVYIAVKKRYWFW